MKIKIVYFGNTPHIFFDEKEVNGVCLCRGDDKINLSVICKPTGT